jgi:hypothetical protein
MENLLNGAGSLPQTGAVLQQFCIAAVVVHLRIKESDQAR